MIARLRQYVVMAAKLWGKLYAGPILAVAGLAALILQRSVPDIPQRTWAEAVSYLTLAAAISFVLVAQYQAWALEREEKQSIELRRKEDLERAESRRKDDLERAESRRIQEVERAESRWNEAEDRRKGDVERLEGMYRAEREKNGRPLFDGSIKILEIVRDSGTGKSPGRAHTTQSVRLFASITNTRPTASNLKTLEFDASALMTPASVDLLQIENPGQIFEHAIHTSFHVLVRFSRPASELPELHLDDTSGLRVFAVDAFGERHELRLEPNSTTAADEYQALDRLRKRLKG